MITDSVRPATVLSLLLPLVSSCAFLDDHRTNWELPSSVVPGAVVVCQGERRLSREQCLELGERHLDDRFSRTPRRVEVSTWLARDTCDFAVIGGDNLTMMFATGPCRISPP